MRQTRGALPHAREVPSMSPSTDVSGSVRGHHDAAHEWSDKQRGTALRYPRGQLSFASPPKFPHIVPQEFGKAALARSAFSDNRPPCFPAEHFLDA